MADAQSPAPYLWLDKTVLITGAGQRIGQELGEVLAGKGARVWLGAKQPETFDRLVHALRARCRTISAIALDIADDGSIAAAVGEVGRREGRIDVLINIADVAADQGNPALGSDRPGSDAAKARACLDACFVGPWLAAQHALPLLRRSCSAMIVNVTSGYGRAAAEQGAAPEHDGGRAPKGGLDLLSRFVTTELRLEIGLGKHGTARVLSVTSDSDETDMAAAARLVAAIAEPSPAPRPKTEEEAP